MGGYVANFTVYTLAMTGLICFAVFVYKKFMDGSMRTGKTKSLSVEESMSLTPRKSLHIIRAGNEKFLIASDIDRTTLISKLENYESFSNIAPEMLDDYNNVEKDVKVEKSIRIKKDISSKDEVSKQLGYMDKKPVRLEPVQNKIVRSGGRNSRQSLGKNMVTLDFDTSANHGLSPMREMAKKINEL